MARRNLKYKLIERQNIKEQLKLINGSETDYVTPNGNIYKYYGNNMFIKKNVFVNNANGYLYCGISYPFGNKQKRVHRLVAEAYLENPNKYNIVMHKDNNKSNPKLENLKWGTISENTKQAYNDGLAKTDSGYDDSQSNPIFVFDKNKNIIYDFGSISIASKKLKISKNTISNHCKHKIKTKSRCGYYFRYQEEYNRFGFVL